MGPTFENNQSLGMMTPVLTKTMCLTFFIRNSMATEVDPARGRGCSRTLDKGVMT